MFEADFPYDISDFLLQLFVEAFDFDEDIHIRIFILITACARTEYSEVNEFNNIG